MFMKNPACENLNFKIIFLFLDLSEIDFLLSEREMQITKSILTRKSMFRARDFLKSADKVKRTESPPDRIFSISY